MDVGNDSRLVELRDLPVQAARYRETVLALNAPQATLEGYTKASSRSLPDSVANHLLHIAPPAEVAEYRTLYGTGHGHAHRITPRPNLGCQSAA